MTDKKAVVEYRSQGGVDITLSPDVVRNFLVQGKKELVSAQELMYFMNVCKARKLNPFIKDCYLIKYGSEPAAIVTSVDYFRKNARKAPDCKGWRSGIVILKDGELTFREGSLILDDETLVGGWAEAKPKGNIRKKHTVGLKPYIKKTRDGKITRFWQEEKQPDMIAKVAESQLLRQLWGEETTGMYSVEEMPSIEDVKSDGPVQSEIKQRILDGKKQPDPKESFSEKVGVPSDAIDEYQTNVEKKEPDPKPDEPNIKPPVTEDFTEDQVVAIEKTFEAFVMEICKTVNITQAEAYNYINNLKATTGAELVDIMRTMIDDSKAEFGKMLKWLDRGKPADDKGPEPAPTANGKKKRVPLKELEANSKAWKSDNWSRLRSTGFSTYVWKNIETLSSEPEPLQKAVKRKWGKLFKDEFPVPGGNKLNGNGNTAEPPPENVIQAEVYHDPNKNDDSVAPDSDFQQPAPDREKDPDGYIKWLGFNFLDELNGALDYLSLKGRLISALPLEDKVELIKQTERLVDMNA